MKIIPYINELNVPADIKARKDKALDYYFNKNRHIYEKMSIDLFTFPDNNKDVMLQLQNGGVYINANEEIEQLNDYIKFYYRYDIKAEKFIAPTDVIEDFDIKRLETYIDYLANMFIDNIEVVFIPLYKYNLDQFVENITGNCIGISGNIKNINADKYNGLIEYNLITNEFYVYNKK